MQITLSDYNSITLAQFFNKVNGFYRHQAEMQQAEWQRMNYIIFSLIQMNPYIKDNDKPKDFENFLKGNKR